MADWRQIQGRIRKAKACADAPAKLTQLYEKTRDAMVAYELAAVLEKSGQGDEAAAWYSTAAQRFRRLEWKKKAEAALVRLGAPLPPAPAEVAAPPAPSEESAPASPAPPVEPAPSGTGTLASAPLPAPSAAPVGIATPGRRRRRRGRRGGRGRGRAKRAAEQTLASVPATPTNLPGAQVAVGAPPQPAQVPEPPAQERARAEPGRAGPPISRAGEPALASRMAQLESQLRRLISSPLHSLEDAGEAPAGPGVFLLSDLDQVTHYYVEACQTLRIGLKNLLHGRGGRLDGSASLKTNLARHLGINESQVTKYLKQNCAVRWIQVDEGASHLAHFAIAVLRPALNN